MKDLNTSERMFITLLFFKPVLVLALWINTNTLKIFYHCICVKSHSFLSLLQGRKALPRFFLACSIRFCRASLRGSVSASCSKIRLKDLSKNPLCRAQLCFGTPACIWRLRCADSLNGPEFKMKTTHVVFMFSKPISTKSLLPHSCSNSGDST